MDISLQQVGYSYAKGTPFEKRALYEVNASIQAESYTAIVGHTGSGKSTLLLHLNGLLKPTEGVVRIGDVSITVRHEGERAERNTKARRDRFSIS